MDSKDLINIINSLNQERTFCYEEPSDNDDLYSDKRDDLLFMFGVINNLIRCFENNEEFPATAFELLNRNGKLFLQMYLKVRFRIVIELKNITYKNLSRLYEHNRNPFQDTETEATMLLLDCQFDLNEFLPEYKKLLEENPNEQLVHIIDEHIMRNG